MVTKLCVDLKETKKLVSDLVEKGREVKVYQCKELIFVRKEKVQFIVCYKE